MPKMQQKYKIDRTQRTLDAIAIENELPVRFFLSGIWKCVVHDAMTVAVMNFKTEPFFVVEIHTHAHGRLRTSSF